MKKLNKSLYVFLVLVFIFSARSAYADVVINEIQLNPIGERFIELYNPDSSSVDLTNWYIQRKTANGTFGSLVTSSNFANKTIGPGSYFLISRESIANTDIVVDTLTLTESNTIQIKNAGGNVVDKVGWGSTNDCSNPCPPNPIDGKSIQKDSNGEWKSATPTPGKANETNNNSDDSSSSSNDNSNTSTNNTTTTNQNPKEPDITKFTAGIITQNLATAGVDLLIQSSVKYGKEIWMTGKLIWNFGDGSTEEQLAVEPFTHRYMYAGDYVLTLSYFRNYYQKIPDVTDRVIISVLPPGVTISSVGGTLDPYVELENTSKYEISLSSWILKSGEAIFTIPEGTIILPSKKLVFGSAITHFTEVSSVSLLRPSGQITSVFPTQLVRSAIQYAPQEKSSTKDTNTPTQNINSSVIDLSAENQTAQAGSASVSMPMEIVGVVVLAVLGISGAYLFMRKKNAEGDSLCKAKI